MNNLYMEYFLDEIQKIAAEDKEKGNTGSLVGLGTGGVVGGMGFIDRRKSIIPDKKIKLGNTYEEAAKHLKKGDVLVGAFTTMDSNISDMKKGVRDAINENKNTKDVGVKVKNILKALSPNSLVSKLVDPKHSHAEMMINTEKVFAYGSDKPEKAYLSTMPLNKQHEKIWKDKFGYKPHYTVLRPVNPDNVVKSGITQKRIKEINPKYDGLSGIKAAIKDAILPKLNTTERAKTTAELASDACRTKGSCATFPAQNLKTTIGGKATKDVLPVDYTKSKTYQYVGNIGYDYKPGIKARIASAAPKVALRGAAGLTAGFAAKKIYDAIKSDKK